MPAAPESKLPALLAELSARLLAPWAMLAALVENALPAFSFAELSKFFPQPHIAYDGATELNPTTTAHTATIFLLNNFIF
jgi:hypothetical protein